MKKELRQGLYLVVDPVMDLSLLIERLQQVVDKKGIVAVQVWDNFQREDDIERISASICDVCRRSRSIPVFLNNHWERAITLGMDGVHFDSIPDDWLHFKERCPKEMLIGLTVNNDMEVAKWAANEKLDYVSFCSMFPSETANSCDLVVLDSVRKLTESYNIQVFLAGGIRPDNIHELQELDYDGIAVVSGVMSAINPAEAVKLYLDKMK